MKFVKRLFTFSFLIYVSLGLLTPAISQEKIPAPQVITYGINEDANTRVPPPPILGLPRDGIAPRTTDPRAQLRMTDPQFQVTYSGFTSEARAAFQYAVDIWASLIRSNVTIRINASYTSLAEGSLGGSNPNAYYRLTSGDRLYPAALTDALAGSDQGSGEPDILTQFNSGASWYFGTDGYTPSGQFDFVSVVLHEIGHGLSLVSGAGVDENTSGVMVGKIRRGSPTSYPAVYEFFVVNGSGTSILTFTDPSAALFQQLTGDDLFWNGTNGVAGNGGSQPKLYAPTPWDPGSSYLHLDEMAFPPGDPNSLMTPHVFQSEGIHNPGPIALGMLADMGWTINAAPTFTEGETATRSIAENTSADQNIGSAVSATDADHTTLAYSLGGTDAAAFAIDSTSGQLKTKAVLDYETQSTYTLIITAADSQSLADTITVTINVTDVNEAPVYASESVSLDIPENAAVNTNIGGPLSATDPEGDSLTYTLGGTDAASFSIVSSSGQLQTNTSLDYDTKDTYTVTVTATDSNSGNDSITVTINVVDIAESANDAPVFTQGSAITRTVAEHTQSGINIGDPVVATDPDSDLTGLEHATGLERLDLGNNAVTNIAALTNLIRLENLDLADNQITSISTLSSLTRLEVLDLRDNDVTDTVLLSTMTHLKNLYVRGNANLSSLKQLVKLKEAGTRVDITLPKPVTLRDANLAAELRSTLNFQADDPIFPEDMETLTTLNASSQNIANLTGLETATGLTSLNLSDNDISSLTPLAKLVLLDTLDLSENNISSISSLSRLTALTNLNLSNNRIPSVSSLAKLSALTDLNLSHNNISSLTSLSGLSSLVALDLFSNRIRDVLPLQGLRSLRTLDLSGNDDITNEVVLYTLQQVGTNITLPPGKTVPTIADLVAFGNSALEAAVRSALKVAKGHPISTTKITELERLTATHKKIDNLTGLEGATALTRLDLGNNEIAELRPLQNLTSLTNLDLADNQIVNLLPLQNLTNLTYLDLDDNEIEDVSALSNSTSLTHLDLRGNDVLDVAPLRDLTRLRYIYLRGNENLTNLEWLGAIENLRSDIRLPDVVRLADTNLDTAVRDALTTAGQTVSATLPMSEELLESLETLTASNNNIADLMGCEYMTALTSLDLRNNEITDVTPLSRLYSLETLMLIGNPIQDTSVLRELQRRGTTIDITIYRYPFWDVNQDGDVDEADVFLITATITGESPDVNGDGNVDADDETAADANKDGTVDNNDLLFVFEKFDRPMNLGAPLLNAESAGLDWALLERIDADGLRVQLEMLRAENDGSLKYQQAIAFLQAVLAALQPNQTLLLANYPNPFNPETWIPYQLAQSSNIWITIYDMRGAVVRRLALGYRPEGYYRVRGRAAHWDGRNAVGERVASGIYFYQLRVDETSFLRKMVILK